MSAQRLLLISAVLLVACPGALRAQVAVEPAPLNPRLAVPLTAPTPREQQIAAARPLSAADLETIRRNQLLSRDPRIPADLREQFAEVAESLEELSMPVVAVAAPGDAAPAQRAPLTAGWVESTVLPEIAAFVANRARTEALASASEQLRTRMCPNQAGAGVVDPRKVLVATCALTLNSNPYETPVAWTTYKAAFEEDISRLPERFLQEFTCGAGTCAVPAARVRTLALTGLRVVRRMERGQDPILLLGNLATPDLACPAGAPGPDYCQSLRSLGIGVHTLQHLLAEVSRDTAALTRALQSPTFFPNVVGRLEGELQKIDSTLKPDAQRTLRLTEAVRRLAVRLAELQRIGQELPKSTSQAEAFSRYTGAALQIFGLLPELRPHEWDDAQTQQFDTALQRIDEVAEAVEQIRARRYANAFVQITVLAARMRADGHMGAELPSWFHRYGPFVAEVASAQSSEAFQSVLQSAAAPMGSYRRKRAGGFTLAVNAYMGFQGGREELRGLRQELGDDAAGHFGLSMPIGLEGSVGIGAASVGLFGSLVDLGNLANFRTSEKEDAEGEISGEPKVSLSSVISPGLYAVLGLSKRFPLTLGAGFSWPLDVRSVRYPDGDEGEASASRFSLFLGIDVPLLRF